MASLAVMFGGFIKAITLIANTADTTCQKSSFHKVQKIHSAQNEKGIGKHRNSMLYEYILDPIKSVLLHKLMLKKFN